MSSDAPEAATPDAKPPAEKEGCLVRLLPVTTPGCASCLTSVFLILTVTIVWLFFFLDPLHVPWRHAIGWPRIVAIVALVIAIPLVLNRMLRWWTEGEPTPFPDLEAAWYAGLQALASHGLSLSSLPLYVVVGSASERQERALMDAAGLSLLVAGVPQGPAPLRWYASSQAVFLFCSDASWTSALASLREELAAEASAKGISSPEVPQPQLLGGESAAPFDLAPPPSAPAAATSPLPAPAAAPAAPALPSDATASPAAARGTLMLDQFLAQMPATGTPAAPPAGAPAAPAAADTAGAAPTAFRGTLMLGGPSEPPPAATGGPPAAASGPRAVMPASVEASGPLPTDALPPVLVAAQYSAVCLQQLRFIGDMLARSREPVCPLNGVLVLLQFESIYATPAEIEELQQAIAADVATLQYATQLRCPVTALVVGLEKERGFQELVRRVGKERSMTQRFGRKFDVRAIPTAEELTALSAHVCGAFEDWVYVLFREDATLARPGNPQLYELLSKVRCTWKTRLADILALGFGCEMTEDAQRRSLLFSGCYAASTGETPDRQAFVKGVVEKLLEEQELVEWTPDALRHQKRRQLFAAVGTLTCALLLLGFVATAVYRWWK